MAAAPGGPGPDLGSDPGTSSGRPAPPSAPHRFVPAAAGAWCDLCCRFVVSQGLRCAGERPPTPRSLLSRPVPSRPCDTGWGLACFVGGNGAAVAASCPAGRCLGPRLGGVFPSVGMRGGQRWAFLSPLRRQLSCFAAIYLSAKRTLFCFRCFRQA